MHRVAFTVAEHLDLDVAGMAQILLDIDRRVAEGRACFRARGRQRQREFFLVVGHLHASAAAAGGRLDDHRKADLLGDLGSVLVRGDFTLGSRNHGNAKRFRGLLGGDLVAHDADVIGGRSDEGDAVGIQDVGELGVLGEKAVARMHRVRTGDLAGSDDLVDVEIAVARGRRPDANALVCKAHMHGVLIGSGMHRDSLDTELLAGAQHPERDLTTVCNENLGEHRLAHLFYHDHRFGEFDRVAVADQNADNLAGAR
jgi:hypothetical protein